MLCDLRPLSQPLWTFFSSPIEKNHNSAHLPSLPAPAGCSAGGLRRVGTGQAVWSTITRRDVVYLYPQPLGLAVALSTGWDPCSRRLSPQKGRSSRPGTWRVSGCPRASIFGGLNGPRLIKPRPSCGDISVDGGMRRLGTGPTKGDPGGGSEQACPSVLSPRLGAPWRAARVGKGRRAASAAR